MRPRFRLGLRTVKTALSVMLSLYLASLFGELSIFPALASVSVMSRTFDEGLLECRNQAVGILIGGVFGCLTVFLFSAPPIWIMGLGVMLIIFICSSFGIGFSCSLSSAIFIVACMTAREEVLQSVLIRSFHTAIGLGVGLAINYLIVPYNNDKKILQLLQSYLALVPGCLQQRFYQDTYPDLAALRELLDRLEYELTVYRHQRFLRRRRRRDLFSELHGAIRLAKRIYQELLVLCSVDRLATPSAELLAGLDAMGLPLPPEGLPQRSFTPEDSTVTDYHLSRLLQAQAQLARNLDTK